MNHPDGSLENLRKKQDKRKEPRPIKSKGFLRRNARRFLVAGLFALVLSWLALAPGIGYTATVDIASSTIYVHGHPCYGYVCQGTVNVTFYPVLYPANHLFGSEISAGFARLSEPWDSSGESVKESVTTEVLLSEFPINIPFLYAASFILVVVLEKAIRKVFWRAPGGSPPASAICRVAQFSI